MGGFSVSSIGQISQSGLVEGKELYTALGLGLLGVESLDASLNGTAVST